jgi:hypothetical protein
MYKLLLIFKFIDMKGNQENTTPVPYKSRTATIQKLQFRKNVLHLPRIKVHYRVDYYIII